MTLWWDGALVNSDDLIYESITAMLLRTVASRLAKGSSSGTGVRCFALSVTPLPDVSAGTPPPSGDLQEIGACSGNPETFRKQRVRCSAADEF